MALGRLLIFAVACAFVLSLASAAQAQKLVKAEFKVRTINDNKDADTAVFVEVRSNDQKVLLAEAANADADKEYKVDSENTLALTVKTEGSTPGQCDKFVFRVGIKPKGDDAWIFEGKVTLTFDNGQAIVQEIPKTEIKGYKDQLTWTNYVGGK